MGGLAVVTCAEHSIWSVVLVYKFVVVIINCWKRISSDLNENALLGPWDLALLRGVALLEEVHHCEVGLRFQSLKPDLMVLSLPAAYGWIRV